MQLLINAATARMGGGVTYLRHLVPALRDTAPDIDATVLAPARTADQLRRLDMRIETLRDYGGVGAMLAARRHMRRDRRRFDVVYSLGNIAVPLPGCPQVIAIRNMLLFPPFIGTSGFTLRARAGLEARSRLCRASAAVSAVTIVPTDAMRAVVAATLPGPTRCRLRVVHHGLAGDLQADRERGESVRSRLGLDRGQLIVYPTLAAPHKDYATVIRAMARVRNPDARLLLVAEPTFDPGLRRLMRELHVEERICLLRRVASEYMPVLYGMADAVVWASRVESFGFPLLEAMRCRVPVAAVDTRVNRELAGATVLYHTLGDAKALAATLDRLLDTPGDGRLEAAYRRSLDFTWERSATQLANALRRAAASVSG